MLNLDALPNAARLEAQRLARIEMKFRRASRPPGPPGCDNYYISKEVREWQAVERKWMQSEFDRIMHALLRKPRSGC